MPVNCVVKGMPKPPGSMPTATRRTRVLQFRAQHGGLSQSFAGGNDLMVLKPDSKFFRYLKSPHGNKQ